LTKGLGVLSLIENSEDTLTSLLSSDAGKAGSSFANASTDFGSLTFQGSGRLALAGKLMGHFGSAYQMGEGVSMYIDGDMDRGAARFFSGMGTAMTLAGAGPAGWVLAVGALGVDVIWDYKEDNQIAVPHM
jgi:hypothetical protein